MDAALLVLEGWAGLKKEEISAMTEAEIASARANAYGGAGNTQNLCIFRNHEVKLIIPCVYKKCFFFQTLALKTRVLPFFLSLFWNNRI